MGTRRRQEGDAFIKVIPRGMAVDPKLVVLFSGKRKSGKDYVVERLQQL